MAINYDKDKVLAVDIDLVRPNPWNPKDKDTEEYKVIRRGIKEKGLIWPIYVRQIDGGYEIIDGEQRHTACKELGFKTILIYNAGEVGDKEARELTLWFEQHVPFNEVSLAHLVEDLAERYNDLSIPYSSEQINNYLKMAQFDFDSLTSSEGNPDDDYSSVAVAFYQVTLEQKDVIDRAIKKVRLDNPSASDGRALELICADYLAG